MTVVFFRTLRFVGLSVQGTQNLPFKVHSSFGRRYLASEVLLHIAVSRMLIESSGHWGLTFGMSPYSHQDNGILVQGVLLHIAVFSRVIVSSGHCGYASTFSRSRTILLLVFSKGLLLHLAPGPVAVTFSDIEIWQCSTFTTSWGHFSFGPIVNSISLEKLYCISHHLELLWLFGTLGLSFLTLVTEVVRYPSMNSLPMLLYYIVI